MNKTPWRINEKVSISVGCNCARCRRVFAVAGDDFAYCVFIARRERFAGC